MGPKRLPGTFILHVFISALYVPNTMLSTGECHQKAKPCPYGGKDRKQVNHCHHHCHSKQRSNRISEGEGSDGGSVPLLEGPCGPGIREQTREGIEPCGYPGKNTQVAATTGEKLEKEQAVHARETKGHWAGAK